MTECGVRVRMSDWRDWLAWIADTRTLRAVELPADMLEPTRPEILDVCAHLGLTVLHLADVLPPNLGRHFAESDLACDEHAVKELRRGLGARLKGGARVASLDVGLDRMSGDRLEEGLRARITLLQSMLLETGPLGVALAIRVRIPRPYPGSHAWEWAGNIIHDLGPERCSLAVDVAMSDLPASFDPDAFVRSCASHLAVVRFFYLTSRSERPGEDIHAAWGKALRSHGANVAVIFCPRLRDQGGGSAVLADIERWGSLYSA